MKIINAFNIEIRELEHEKEGMRYADFDIPQSAGVDTFEFCIFVHEGEKWHIRNIRRVYGKQLFPGPNHFEVEVQRYIERG